MAGDFDAIGMDKETRDYLRKLRRKLRPDSIRNRAEDILRSGGFGDYGDDVQMSPYADALPDGFANDIPQAGLAGAGHSNEEAPEHGTVQLARLRVPRPPPQLRVIQKKVGNLGISRQFSLVRPSDLGGAIIQHVEGMYRYKDRNDNVHTKPINFWEAWTIAPKETRPRETKNQIDPKTRKQEDDYLGIHGKVMPLNLYIEAHAKFYEGMTRGDLRTLGFAMGRVKEAGSGKFAIWSSYDAPDFSRIRGDRPSSREVRGQFRYP